MVVLGMPTAQMEVVHKTSTVLSNKQMHRVSYLQSMTTVLERQSQKLYIAHDWHLRPNYLAPGTIANMTRMKLPLRLPASLKKAGELRIAEDVRSYMKPENRIRGLCRQCLQVTPWQQISKDRCTLHETQNGYKYFLTITELHKRFKMVYLLQNKSDTERYMLVAVKLFRWPSRKICGTLTAPSVKNH